MIGANGLGRDGLRVKGAAHGVSAEASFFGNLSRDALGPANWAGIGLLSILRDNCRPRFQQFSIAPDMFVALGGRQVEAVKGIRSGSAKIFPDFADLRFRLVFVRPIMFQTSKP